MHTPTGQAEKLLSAISLKAEPFNRSAHMDKVHNASLPETFTREEVRELFLLPLQAAVAEDRRIAAQTSEALEKLRAAHATCTKQMAKLQYRIDHIFKHNEVKPKPRV